MNLKLQLISLLFSFAFGCIFYFVIWILDHINKKYNIVLKYIISFIVIMIMAFVYFICLLYINNGYLHFYFLLSIMAGYIFNSFLINIYFTRIKKSKM